MFSLICVWINGWANNREVGDLRRYRAYYDVIVMLFSLYVPFNPNGLKQWDTFMVNASIPVLVGDSYEA